MKMMCPCETFFCLLQSLMKELKVHLLQLLCMEFVYGLVEGALFALVVRVYVLID